MEAAGREMNHLAAIIPAAGYSSRMKQFKPLLTIGGDTLTDRVISLFSRYEIDIFLVTGWQKEKLLAGIRNTGIRIIENPDYASGMFTSIQAGVKRLDTNYQGFFVLPVDIPLVRPSTIRKLLENFQPQSRDILYPVCLNKRGHPPLIPSNLIPEILNWNGQGGLKAVLQRNEDKAREIEVADENILLDLDTDEDYALALELFRRYSIPSNKEQAAILDICRVDPARRRHCLKVAEIADCIGKALIESGHGLDLEIVRAAAALHDIVREQPRHDETGGKLLTEMGFKEVGDVVCVHTFLDQKPSGLELESEVVYLADKFVQGDQVVSLEQRFQISLQKHAVTPTIEERINQRKQRAYAVKRELEEMLQYPMERLLFE
jgi:CTP:molybdopterin cytidylyltransferase MocA/HD superfamily phosphohydrolase YqeK